MQLKSLLTWLATLGAASLALTACAGAPKQIATYPNLGPAPTPIAREPYPPGEVIVYHADLEMEVGDVDAAADRASTLASQYGGYLESSQSWYQDGHKTTTLELAVPPARFDDLRHGLLDLGTLIRDRVSSDTFNSDEWARSGRTSHIRVQLQPAPFPPALPNGWNPARTFERAFNVIASIFQVIADIMIWVVVVAGPFVVIGLVVWIVVRQVRRQH